MDSRPLFKIFLLRTPYILRPDGTSVTIENHQMIQLLALLLLQPERMYLRRDLCQWFYPDHAEKQAEQNLRQMIHRLRKILDDDDTDPMIIGEPLTLRLSTSYIYDVDVHHFNTLVQNTQKHSHRRLTACGACIKNLEQAAELFQYEFMSGIHFRGPLEEWVFVQRTALLQKMVFTLRNLIGYSLQRGRWFKAQDYIEKWLSLDALDEEAVALQMRLFVVQGRRTFALQFYQRFAMLLRRHLDIEPSEEIGILAQSVQNGTLSPEKILSQPSRTGLLTLKPPFNQRKTFEEFPYLQIPFVGRTDETRIILERLGDHSTRLFTITGMTGIGKSRLALHVAQLDTENWIDGTTVVYMEDEHDLYKGLLKALNHSPEPGRALDAQVYQLLKDKEILIVLDHIDHVADIRFALKMLLFQAPRIKLIVTSRERLGIAGEMIVHLYALPYPKQAFEMSDDQTTASVELFYTSVKNLYPLVNVMEHDRPAIMEICHLLHGSPFALVLAALLLQSLSCQQIAQSIGQNQDFLKDIQNFLPARQQSIRTVFMYLWEKLDSLSRYCLQRLAAGSPLFTLLQAQEDYNIAPEYVMNLLDKSFLEFFDSQYIRIHPLFKPFIVETAFQLH